ncbi:MAG TPA: PKD domain-containing protein, partial [Gaiellaceae bacterium]|nr:PKD domain-containing protein [Gaiellaceae bacterium]
CNKFATVLPTSAIWHHGDFDGCNHAVQGPRGHKGIVHFYVSDGTWICTEQYDGTITGTGGAGACLKAAPPPPPAKYRCTGNQIKLFDNSNGNGVLNGAKPPSFSTKGKSYCVTQIDTYHWNNGKGATPGWLGLKGPTTVGPARATGSAGQGGAKNVNWTLNISQSKPAVINGTYECTDTDAATWSQNPQTGGKGFCTVYVTNAVKVAGSGTSTTTKSTTTTKKTTTTSAKKKSSSKLSIKATPDTGNPPLTVTFALSSPKVVQWRVDFGDGQFKVAIGQPPATLTHVYIAKGDYKPRITVITSATATSSSSATTNVQVGTALMSFAASPAAGSLPLKVTFTLGTSVVNITTWTVDFGDGQHTAGGGKPPASVTHTYTKAGSYRAVFSVKPGQYALVAAFAQVTAGGGTPPVLSLSATPTSGAHPLKVTFTLGTNIPGTIVSWEVVFGDGSRTSGSGKPPATVSHSYAKAGTYGAYLVVAQQQQYGGVQYIVPRGGLAVTVK